KPARSDPLPEAAPRPRRLQHTQSEPRLDIGATLAQARVPSPSRRPIVVEVGRSSSASGSSIGTAQKLLALHPGAWQIPFQEHNVAAARLWSGMAAGAGGETFREERQPVPGEPRNAPRHGGRRSVP